MPRILGAPNPQDPLPLVFPVITELGRSHGVITDTVDVLPKVDPAKKITLGRLTGLYGLQLGPTDHVSPEGDPLLEVTREDFNLASFASIQAGLYINPGDPRYNARGTEQLVKLRRQGTPRTYGGVVFPSDEFRVITYSPRGMVQRVMAQTRKANLGNNDPDAVEATIGRSAGHTLVEKTKALNKLNDSLAAHRDKTLIPLQNEALRNTQDYWKAHFLSRNLDKLRRAVDEEYHATIDTAAINLNVGAKALKAAHLAAASKLYREPNNRERSKNWVMSLNLLRGYVQERRRKIVIARMQCEDELTFYQPFLDQHQNHAA